MNETPVCCMNDVIGCKDPVERSGFVAMVGSNKSRFVISHHRDKVRAKTTKTAFSQGYRLIFIGDGMVYGRPSIFSYWETSEKNEKRTALLRFECSQTRLVRKKTTSDLQTVVFVCVLCAVCGRKVEVGVSARRHY